MYTGKIKARYENGVIEPLERILLPEGQELEIEFRSVPAAAELSVEEKLELVEKMGGALKGTFGRTLAEIDAYIKSERESWDRNF